MKPDELRKLKRDTRWPGWKGSTSTDPLAPFYTVSLRHNNLGAVSTINNGFKLYRHYRYAIGAAGGVFAGTVGTRFQDSVALTVFGVDTSGNSAPLAQADIDFNEIFEKIGAREDVTVDLTDPNIGNPMPVDSAGNPCFESFYDRLWLVGYPILAPFAVPYYDGASWQNAISNIASAPTTVYTNNLAASGNGHCNVATSLMDNFCCAFSPLLWNATCAYSPVGIPVVYNYHWAEAITREVIGGTQPQELTVPTWFDPNNATQDSIKHGHVYFDTSIDPIYGIAWYVFDIYDWWFNIVNNGWQAANIYLPATVPEAPLLTSTNANKLGAPYFSNAGQLIVITEIYAESAVVPTQSLIDAEDTFNDLSDMQDFIPGAVAAGDALWPMAVPRPAATDDDGNLYLQREKQ